MKPRHVVEEIIADYRRSILMGMTERQARMVLTDMLCDYIKAHGTKNYEMGEKAGRFGAFSDQAFSVHYRKRGKPEDSSPRTANQDAETYL
jgi:hypothetical protein